MKYYYISQKVDIALVLIIILWQNTLLQHDDHRVLQENTLNINKQSMDINDQLMRAESLRGEKYAGLLNIHDFVPITE